MIQLRHLLVATDLGPDSATAFAHARALAAAFSARLTLYHAVPVPDHRYAHWAFAHGHEVWVAAERHARAELERWGAGITGPYELVLERRSSALEGVLDALRVRQPDLVVLGTHGRDRLAHLMLGSMAEDVMTHAFRSVFCVPPQAHGEPGVYRRILVPTDFSLASQIAFPMAALFARTFGSEVTLLHVVPGSHKAAATKPSDELRRPTEEAVRALAQEALGGDLAIFPRVRSGHVWERIVETAKASHCDLIVMATRGHDSFSDRILGSNTERVLRHAHCPVLVA